MWSLPVVAETFDGFLNDINGFHVKPAHAWAALDGARGSRVAEGCVGGGTGMIGFGWKGGIGTASRGIDRRAGSWTVGTLVQLNCGRPDQLSIARGYRLVASCRIPANSRLTNAVRSLSWLRPTRPCCRIN
jgi:L-aminopeptidase/D-esterase-like protein